MLRLENKVCVVTGAARGIGKAIAEAFASEGARVYAIDLPSAEFETPERGLESGGEIIHVNADITDSDSVRASFMRVKKECGRLDALANNAAIISYEMLGMISKDKLRKMFEVDVFAMIEMIQYASRLMARNGGGSIINMASIVGTNGAAGQLAYAAAKGAVVALTKSAAKELAPQNIRVNAVAPGMVATKRLVAEMSGRFEEKTGNIGLGRMATPEDIANVYLFLASNAASYISGQILGVDGCMVL
ncbi:SDR family NAD(P)-dependent oxidoreductase [Synergistes jonesii]|uniref:Ketoreductase domain-containing protein n=1 Tax=Synergistes jonesii TaxID=2754 RepID=A0A073IP65_9BACT|nr:SDR family oxidoreductase [Synergistes jonesii]KEJ92153.1 hypothetical protein EH55_05300 [Synergistes jonesii]OFB62593.1 hypothetical protein JS73_07435 [Synergistes jonesii]OFB63255.1 hypothetical protein JS79_07960 [Synergistes jonesii]OFB64829.1 hypothetical protein JS72_03440 [Synergistes jonesii]OFB67591.1 hypothetical protein JS78_07440 [Synergistes jonesii]